jgi:outer membrane biosynthesis protein TonB
MPDRKPSSDVLGSLPRTRPQRRSSKRADAPVTAAADVTETKPTPKPKRAPAKPKTTAAATKPKPKRAPAKPKTTAAATKPKPKPARPKAAAAKKPATPRATATAAAQPAPPTSPRTETQQQPSQPRRSIEPPSGTDILQTAAQAAGDIASLGIEAGRRAVRGALSRLPRP